MKTVVLYKGPSVNIPHSNADTNTNGSCRNGVSLKTGFNWYKNNSMVEIVSHVVNPPVPLEQGNCTQLQGLFVSQYFNLTFMDPCIVIIF